MAVAGPSCRDPPRPLGLVRGGEGLRMAAVIATRRKGHADVGSGRVDRANVFPRAGPRWCKNGQPRNSPSGDVRGESRYSGRASESGLASGSPSESASQASVAGAGSPRTSAIRGSRSTSRASASTIRYLQQAPHRWHFDILDIFSAPKPRGRTPARSSSARMPWKHGGRGVVTNIDAEGIEISVADLLPVTAKSQGSLTHSRRRSLTINLHVGLGMASMRRWSPTMAGEI